MVPKTQKNSGNWDPLGFIDEAGKGCELGFGRLTYDFFFSAFIGFETRPSACRAFWRFRMLGVYPYTIYTPSH